MRTRIAYCVLCVIGVISVGRVDASTESTTFGHYFKEGADLYSRPVTLAGAETVVMYTSAEACADTHKTKKNRDYAHYHIRHALPKDVMVNGVAVSVTATKVVAFWDVEYAGYDGTGQGAAGWDKSKNCHGYAFESGTWCTGVGMDSIERYKADYIWTASAGADDSRFAHVEASYTHCIKSKYKLLTCTMGSMTTPITKIIETKEKFYDSPIYSKSGGSCTTSIALKSRFEFLNVDLPGYTTHGDCTSCH